jgi:transcriptional regulator GlxA family with amidase domain
MKISVFVPKYGVMEVLAPTYRSFNTANDLLQACGKKPIFDVEFVGMQEFVTTHTGEYTVKTHRRLNKLITTDLLLIPPTVGDASEGITANAEAIPYFNKLYHNGASLASLCIGAFLLAETGLLDGKKCSTHWAYIDEFRAKYPTIEVEDGAVITDHANLYSSGGANSFFNLVLYLIEKFSDRETAVLLSKYFALDIDRNSQTQFSIFKGQRNHHDEEIGLVQDFIENNFDQKITIDQLASMIHLGRRTFERRFSQVTNNTAIEYIQRVKVEAAKKFLEASHKSIAEVMYDVGYSDTKAFRDVFKKVTGLTPIEYKSKFCKTHLEKK